MALRTTALITFAVLAIGIVASAPADGQVVLERIGEAPVPSESSEFNSSNNSDVIVLSHIDGPTSTIVKAPVVITNTSRVAMPQSIANASDPRPDQDVHGSARGLDTTSKNGTTSKNATAAKPASFTVKRLEPMLPAGMRSPLLMARPPTASIMGNASAKAPARLRLTKLSTNPPAVVRPTAMSMLPKIVMPGMSSPTPAPAVANATTNDTTMSVPMNAPVPVAVVMDEGASSGNVPINGKPTSNTTSFVPASSPVPILKMNVTTVPMAFQPPSNSTTVPMAFQPSTNSATVPMAFQPPSNSTTVPMAFQSSMNSTTVPMAFQPSTNSATVPMAFQPPANASTVAMPASSSGPVNTTTPVVVLVNENAPLADLSTNSKPTSNTTSSVPTTAPVANMTSNAATAPMAFQPSTNTSTVAVPASSNMTVPVVFLSNENPSSTNMTNVDKPKSNMPTTSLMANSTDAKAPMPMTFNSSGNAPTAAVPTFSSMSVPVVITMTNGDAPLNNASTGGKRISNMAASPSPVAKTMANATDNNQAPKPMMVGSSANNVTVAKPVQSNSTSPKTITIDTFGVRPSSSASNKTNDVRGSTPAQNTTTPAAPSVDVIMVPVSNATSKMNTSEGSSTAPVGNISMPAAIGNTAAAVPPVNASSGNSTVKETVIPMNVGSETAPEITKVTIETSDRKQPVSSRTILDILPAGNLTDAERASVYVPKVVESKADLSSGTSSRPASSNDGNDDKPTKDAEHEQREETKEPEHEEREEAEHDEAKETQPEEREEAQHDEREEAPHEEAPHEEPKEANHDEPKDTDASSLEAKGESSSSEPASRSSGSRSGNKHPSPSK